MLFRKDLGFKDNIDFGLRKYWMHKVILRFVKAIFWSNYISSIVKFEVCVVASKGHKERLIRWNSKHFSFGFAQNQFLSQQMKKKNSTFSSLYSTFNIDHSRCPLSLSLSLSLSRSLSLALSLFHSPFPPPPPPPTLSKGV